MPLKLIIAAIFLFQITNIQAREIDCSLSDGSLVFQDHSRSGGAHPYPGMLIRSVTWSYQGAKVFVESEYYPCHEGCEEEQNEDMTSNITWTMNAQTEVILSEENYPYGKVKKFAVEMELKSKDYPQNMTGMTIPSLKEWFICQEKNFLYP